jgi:hypothetical protein
MTFDEVFARETLADTHSLVTHHASILHNQEFIPERLDVKLRVNCLHLRVRSCRDI